MIRFMTILTAASVEFSNDKDDDVCYKDSNVDYNDIDVHYDAGPVLFTGVGWEPEQRGWGEDQQQDGAAGERDLRPQAQGGGVLHRHRRVCRQTKWNRSV